MASKTGEHAAMGARGRGCTFVVLVLALASVVVARTPGVEAHPSSLRSCDDQGLTAARALLSRVLGGKSAELFSLACAKNCPPMARRCFTLEDTGNGTVHASAPSVPDLLYGIGQYLRAAYHFSFAWQKTGGNVVKPLSRPLVPIASLGDCKAASSQNSSSHRREESLRRQAGTFDVTCTAHRSIPMVVSNSSTVGHMRGQTELQYTYYQNVVTASYSMVWWDWNRWQQEIDWMALNGVNLALAYTGQEEVYRRVYTRLNVSESALLSYFDGPTFLAWSRGQGKAGVGGPLPKAWLAQQFELQQNITRRQHMLGIGTILPAFQGNVPSALARVFPTANISNGWLDAFDPLFSDIADMVMAELIASFGRTGFYQADGFFNHATGPWLLQRPRSVQHSLNSPLASWESGALPFCPSSCDTCSCPPSEGIHQRPNAPQHAPVNSQAPSQVRDSDTQCKFSPPQPNTTLPICSEKCATYDNLKSAVQACAATQTCGGVVADATNSSFQLRASSAGVHSYGGETAWTITNAATCRSIPTDQDAFARAKLVYSTMSKRDPSAVWVYQGWIWLDLNSTQGLSYIKGFTSAVPQGGLVLLDMQAEENPIWTWTQSFFNATFIWCTMDNFGGNNGMYGDVDVVLDRTRRARMSGSGGSSIVGVGITMEGIDQNPAYYTLALDTPWLSNTTSAEAYLTKWGQGRCGSPDDKVTAAWKLLATTVYGPGQRYNLHHFYCPQTAPIISQLQGHEMWTGSYNVSALVQAWRLLIEASSTCNTNAMAFDIADVGRELLSVAPCAKHYDDLMSAFYNMSAQQITAASNELLGVLNDIDRLLTSQQGLLLGEWLQGAHDVAANLRDNSTALMEWNARSQITLWTPYHSGCSPSCFPFHNDYATKLWGGLVKSYFAPRVALFANRAIEAAKEGRSFDVRAYQRDWLSFGIVFEHSTWNKTEIPSEPVGNVNAIAQEMVEKYWGQ